MHARLLHVLTELFGDLPDPSVLQDNPLPALLLPVLPQLEVVELVQAQVGKAHGLPQVVCPGLEGKGVLLAFMGYRGLKVGSFHLTIEVVSLGEEPGRFRGHGSFLTGSRRGTLGSFDIGQSERSLPCNFGLQSLIPLFGYSVHECSRFR
jgi:hypothetical protein